MVRDTKKLQRLVEEGVEKIKQSQRLEDEVRVRRLMKRAEEDLADGAEIDTD